MTLSWKANLQPLALIVEMPTELLAVSFWKYNSGMRQDKTDLGPELMDTT